MATVFQRVRFFCKLQKTFLWQQKDRNEVGKLVAATFRSQYGEVPEKRTASTEPEGKFNVQWYPTEFISEIDRVIREYKVATPDANNSKKEDVPRFTIETVPEPVDARKKRKRILVNKIPVMLQKINLEI